MGSHQTTEKSHNNILFYDPALFPELKILSENYKLILEELNAARSQKIIPPEDTNGSIAKDWTSGTNLDKVFEKTKGDVGWLHWWTNNHEAANLNWTTYGLIFKGQQLTENCKICPKTTELLSKIKGIRVASFSRIKPKTEIETHVGYTGRRYGSLAYHCSLVLPAAPGCCGLQCGRMIHTWKELGEVIIFDDTYPHRAWNSGDEERIVLYLDFDIPLHANDKITELEIEAKLKGTYIPRESDDISDYIDVPEESEIDNNTSDTTNLGGNKVDV